MPGKASAVIRYIDDRAGYYHTLEARVAGAAPAIRLTMQAISNLDRKTYKIRGLHPAKIPQSSMQVKDF